MCLKHRLEAETCFMWKMRHVVEPLMLLNPRKPDLEEVHKPKTKTVRGDNSPGSVNRSFGLWGQWCLRRGRDR